MLRNIMKNLIISALLVSNTILAGTVNPRTVCPSISEDANSVLSTLEEIQANINSSEECNTISETIGSLGSVLTSDKWKKYKSIVSGETSTSLEGAEVEELETLTKSASNSIAQVISLIGNNESCLKKKSKNTTLGSISSIVKEISTVVGNVSGPYSFAISLSGSILSKAIEGIDQIFKNNRPYNFKNLNEEKLFMNQFCSFVEAKKDVKDYLGMSKRKDELLKLDTYLDKKKQDLLENCPLCLHYNIASEAKVAADKILNRMHMPSDIVDLSSGERGSISRCPQIAKEVYTTGSNLSLFYKLLNNYKNPGMSQSDKEYIQQMVSVESVLKEVYPDAKGCAKLASDEKTKISYMFNDFLRDDIFPLSESILGSQLMVFKIVANKKYKMPLGDYISKTIDRKSWVKKQLKTIDQKVKDSLKPENRTPILKRDIELTKRMTEQLMPVYIKHLIKENKKSIKKFQKEFTRFKKKDPDFRRLSTLMNVEIDSRSYLSRQRVLTTKLELSLSQSSKLKKYCEYLKYVASRTSKTDKLCDETALEIVSLYKELSKDQEHFKLMQKYDNWSDLNIETLSSRVADYATKISDWNALGDTRWEAYDPKAPSVEQAVSTEQNDWMNSNPFEEK